VAVLQADGNYDIEKMVNLGDAGDCWKADDLLVADVNVWPNSASYQNGLNATGIEIQVRSDPSFIMQIAVTGLN
jgi:hypothetical protein